MIKYLLLLSILFISCTTLNKSKSQDKYVETFFIGEEGLQYFIKPLIYESNEKNELLIDYTFRYLDTLKGDVTINFSIMGKNIYKELDSMIFQTEHKNYVIHNIQLLFNENKKGNWLSRFSSNINLKDFVTFNNSHYSIIIYPDSLHFHPTNQTNKTHKILKQSLFPLF